jgi:hypothetical protein
LRIHRLEHHHLAHDRGVIIVERAVSVVRSEKGCLWIASKRLRELFGDHALAAVPLDGHQAFRSTVPKTSGLIGAAERERSFEDFLCALRVAAAQEHLAEPSVRFGTLRREFSRRHQNRLRIGEQSSRQVHAPHREQHLWIVEVAGCRLLSYLLHSRGLSVSRGLDEGLAKGHCVVGVRVGLPGIDEQLDRLRLRHTLR